MLGLPCEGKLTDCVQVVMNVEATGRDDRCWPHGSGMNSSFRLGLWSFFYLEEGTAYACNTVST
jgi:hypothetical protein